MKKRACTCGNQIFDAVQELYVIAYIQVDEWNEDVFNQSDDMNNWYCTGGERPTGPYTCTQCGKEYDDLSDLPEIEFPEPAIEKWKRECFYAGVVASEVLDSEEAKAELTADEMREILGWTGDDEYVWVDDNKNILAK